MEISTTRSNRYLSASRDNHLEAHRFFNVDGRRQLAPLMRAAADLMDMGIAGEVALTAIPAEDMNPLAPQPSNSVLRYLDPRIISFGGRHHDHRVKEAIYHDKRRSTIHTI